MIILLIIILLKNKEYKILNFTNILLFITSILWILRSFFLSGCLFFPFIQTCFKTSWAVNIKEVQFFVEEAMRISRTLPTRNGVGDVDFSLHGYRWIPQWINDYFFSAALLQIGSIIIVTTSFLLLLISFLKKYKLKSAINKYDLSIFISIFIILFLWFISAPETRYALGPLISLPCFFIMLVFRKLNLDQFFIGKNVKLSLIMGTLFFLLISKSFSHFKLSDLYINNKIKHNYTHIEKIRKFNNTNYYWGKFLCSDFKEICVNTVKENYIIDKIFNYKVYKSDSWLNE
jgi:hypothetical protein